MIPYNNIRYDNCIIKNEFIDTLSDAMSDSDFILGNRVYAFEKSFAKYNKAKHCVTCASGFDALKIALWSAGIRAGDKVIVPNFSFIATMNAVLSLGAVPIFVDVNPDYPDISMYYLKRAIKEHKVKAVIVVHLYGTICKDIYDIVNLCTENNIVLIEDACQAHGAQLDNHFAGTFGDIGCFSFYPGKNLGGIGDGGACIFRDKKQAETAKRFRNYGSQVKYKHTEYGENSRLDAINASFLDLKLSTLNDINSKRNMIAEIYNTYISPKFRLNYSVSNYHIYAIKMRERTAFINSMSFDGIECLIHYPYVLSTHYKNPILYGGQNAEIFSSTVVSLPIFTSMLFVDAKIIAEKVNNFNE